MQTVKVNGISLAYERQGQGIPLLLVHGFPLDHVAWQPLLPFLAQHFDVIVPDLRGLGASEMPSSGPYTMADLAADLAELLDHLGIRKTCIAGHSMGGYVTLAFARAYPERVQGLGLVASQAAPDTPERKSGRYTQAERVLAEGLEFLADAMAPKLSANPDNIPFFREMILRQPPKGIAGALQAMAERPDSLDLLASFAFPVTLVYGLADELIPPERSRETAAHLPNASLLELPGVGHSPALESPAETAEALKKLI